MKEGEQERYRSILARKGKRTGGEKRESDQFIVFLREEGRQGVKE